MKRVIEEVLQVEEKVSEILRQANAKAAEIRSAADREMAEKTAQAREQSREILKTTVDHAKKEAEQLAAEKLEQSQLEKDALIGNNTEKIEQLVGNICKMIVTTECQANSQ